MTEEELNELYFWLDAESGELEALVEEEFFSRMKEIHDAQLRWENVVTEEGSPGG